MGGIQLYIFSINCKLSESQQQHKLMFIQGPSGDRLLKRSQPYRNQRIINVIRDVYFTGGVASFATRYHRLFPRYHDSQGVTKLEVPEPMLALVATAVIY